MTPYWIFLNLLTISLVSTMAMQKDRTGTHDRTLEHIIEEITEQECSGLTKILEAVNERQESENCSPKTMITQTVKTECPTLSLRIQPTAYLRSITRLTTVTVTIKQIKTVTVKQECPTMSPQPTACLQPTTMTPSCELHQPTPGITAPGKESSQGNRSSTIGLGLLNGILFASLVAVMVGWIVTCFVLKVEQKRSLLTASTSQNVTTEPIPARNIEPLPARNIEQLPTRNIEQLPARNIEPLPAEDVVYEKIDETNFGETMVDLKQNEAYNLSRVTG